MAIHKSSAQLYQLKQPVNSVDLPPAGVTRWVPSRKAQVVSAVRNGILSLNEACERYALTVEEFSSWQRAIERFGLSGLRATRAKQYRQTHH